MTRQAKGGARTQGTQGSPGSGRGVLKRETERAREALLLSLVLLEVDDQGPWQWRVGLPYIRDDDHGRLRAPLLKAAMRKEKKGEGGGQGVSGSLSSKTGRQRRCVCVCVRACVRVCVCV